MALGYAAIITTLFLWSGFFLSLRGGAISNLLPADIALARFLIPAIVLLPFVLKSMDNIRAVPSKYLLGIVVGSGLPYLLVAGTAMHFAPVLATLLAIPVCNEQPDSLTWCALLGSFESRCFLQTKP